MYGQNAQSMCTACINIESIANRSAFSGSKDWRVFSLVIDSSGHSHRARPGQLEWKWCRVTSNLITKQKFWKEITVHPLVYSFETQLKGCYLWINPTVKIIIRLREKCGNTCEKWISWQKYVNISYYICELSLMNYS